MLLENTVWLFDQQTHADRFLLMFDDLGNVRPATGRDRRIVTTSSRQPSMPSKLDWMLLLADQLYPDWDAVALWFDDDIYLPWHLQFAANTIEQHGALWTKPSFVLSTQDSRSMTECGGRLRFFGSVVITRTLLESYKQLTSINKAAGPFCKMIEHAGGNIKSPRWEAQLIAALRQHDEPGDPLDIKNVRGYDSLSYVYRWTDSCASHASLLARGTDDLTWYERKQPDWDELIHQVIPRTDNNTEQAFMKLQLHGNRLALLHDLLR